MLFHINIDKIYYGSAIPECLMKLGYMGQHPIGR